MPVIHLDHAAGRCEIVCGRGLLFQPETWRDRLRGHVLLVTDETVAGHYLAPMEAALEGMAHTAVILPAGETRKTVDGWQRIIDALVGAGAGRDATVLALGGGVIGDLAGFAAATWMRGIRVVQAPTTLLAQVDAAIGGKTGINLPAGKNLVGAFHQPHAVVADVDTLATLSERDRRAGLAEVVKYGAIGDARFLDWLAGHAAVLRDGDPDILLQAVERSAAHKARVVMADERESGSRALLNFGHTFGHALETETGYRRFRHGEAVAIGMVLAAHLSVATGPLESADADALTELLRTLGLPVDLPPELEPERLLAHMRLDKKTRAGRLRLVVLDAPGRARLAEDIPEAAVAEILAEASAQ